MRPAWLAVTLLLALGFAGCGAGSAPPLAAAAEPSKKTLQAFRSEPELAGYLRKLARRQRPFKAAIAPPMPSMNLESAADTRIPESVTNVQHAGVDEGGIVKVHGDHLVVLRRGRLFTVSIAGGDLEPVSSLDAFSPDIDPQATWYDELLISGDTVVVVGYSYERGGTEANLFHISSEGELTYRSTYQLRSNDYYSSRNYASRLVGTKLVLYAPLYLEPENGDLFQDFPAVRKWHKGAKNGEFRRIVEATDVYRPPQAVAFADQAALHTVTTCELAQGDFDCKATSVIGPPGHVFYVSPKAVYVWATEWMGRERASLLYRMPLDGTAPSALTVAGSPVDQFSFLETEHGLNVLVRSGGRGDGMWAAEAAPGDLALLRVPLDRFSDGARSAEPSDYERLPKVNGDALQNRFVGDYLLYGTGSGWGHPRHAPSSRLVAVRWSDGEQRELVLMHGVDRIDQMGGDAVVVGTDGRNLHFTAVHLGRQPELAGGYTRRGASQGELRSQGFFYKTDGPDSGLLGLPISLPAEPGYRHLFRTSAAVLFLHNHSGYFEEMGELAAKPDLASDDHCRASCVDWYGNARPLFLRGRVIALLGYELVEGTAENERITEIRRVSYAPRSFAKAIPGRDSPGKE